MKRIILFGLLTIISVSLVTAQTINISSPYPQTTWHKTKSYDIKWSINGTMDNTVRIALRFNNQFYRLIASSANNNGEYNWTIPNDIQDGAYKIVIRTHSDQYPGVAGRSEIFHIKTLPDPEIEVYKPDSSSKWLKGQPFYIKWHQRGELHSRVRIKLYNSAGTTEIFYITQFGGPADNNGAYKWKVPLFLTPGQYKIFVEDYVNSVNDFSETFEILGAEQFIAITNPSPWIGWFLGKVEDITWTSGGIQGNVLIELLTKEGKPMGTIAKYIPISQGKYEWKVGRYKTKQGKWYNPSNWLPTSGMAKPSRYYRIKIISPSANKHVVSEPFLLMKGNGA